jgi:hypothetical protein
MVRQIVDIPEKDLVLFQELAKKHKWKIEKKDSIKEVADNFVLTPAHLAILEESSNPPDEESVTKKEFFKFLDSL